ncbi:hypothetical protein N9903_01280 [bacterium]|nr:hypothetical protein [bacterium]
MTHEDYFYGCSREYLDSIDPSLYDSITGAINSLLKRATQTELNNDLFWLLTGRGWSYDTLSGITDVCFPSAKVGERSHS